jgi:lysophospholipase L1-like esterase
MKKFILLMIVLSLSFGIGCGIDTPEQPKLNMEQNQLVLSKMVAIGNSLTAGFQSSGLCECMQPQSYPNLIARQMGKAAEFEQPLIDQPGIGTTSGKGHLELLNGKIIAPDLTVPPEALLLNALLPRPYDNLGVPGATLRDVLNATDAATSASKKNSFFNIVLRNPNFGNTTQLQQAITLNPSLILLWIGNNDVLGAALKGGNPALITPQADFQAQFTTLLTELRQKTKAAIIMGNIPYVTDIPYINTMDIIFRTTPLSGRTDSVPVVFDDQFKPVDFGGGLYLPLLTEEKDVAHLTLPALSAYSPTGMGIPNAAAMVQMGLSATQAQAMEQGMKNKGLNPTGQPFPGAMSLTVTENNAIKQAVDGFNSTLQSLAAQFQVPIVDANSMLTALNTAGLEGYSGRFVMMDPANTAFSLDGVHPNDGGYAMVANAFIEKINATFQLTIPKLNPAEFKGQYAGSVSAQITLDAVEQVKAIF